MDLEDVNDLLRDLNLDTDNESNSQSSGAGDDDDNEHGLIIDGTKYVEAKTIARKNRKGAGGKRSSVWKLGKELKRVEDGVKI